MKTSTKKLLRILVCAVLCVTLAFSAVSCTPGEDNNNGEKPTYKITVWVSESANADGVSLVDITKQQIEAFNKLDHNYIIEATVEGVSESESATKMIADVESGADIFCFAQDQTARLVQAGALARPGEKATETIKSSNDAGAVKAATVGENVVCYPITSDNGYFLMYDKRVISEDDLSDLAKLVAACEAAGKNFSMEVETSAWYLASFFFGVGCHSEWDINESGKAIAINDNFNSDAGIIALKGMQQLVKSSAHVSSSSTDDFAAATPSAVVVSGTWGIAGAESALGAENLGYAPLPSFTVDGKTYHMGSYSGNKLMGVKPQEDAVKASALSALALYLSGKDCQMDRFNSFGWGPSNLEAQADENVKKNEALSALASQNNYATPQGQIDGGWWDIAKVIGTGAKEAALNDETALKAVLEKYDADLQGIINKTDDEANMWGVIGDIYGDGWSVDLAMTEKPAGTWTSIPIYLTAENEFKCRQGKAWNSDTGAVTADEADFETAESGNCTAKAEGLYMVKLDATEKLISSIPTTFGVVGTICGENKWDSDIAMTKGEGVSYSTEAVTLKAGDEIKVRYNNSWDYGDIGNAEDGGNFAIEADGSYIVTVTWTDGAWVLSIAAA